MRAFQRVAGTVAVSFVLAVVACGSFGEDETEGTPQPPDAAGATDASDGSATTEASAPADSGPPATIRCGTIGCAATTKCCLPLADKEPHCVDRGAVCGAGFAELLCSSPAACGAGEVCCVTAVRNAGQTEFDLSRSFCVAAAGCPDGNLQRALCDLGSSTQCPGKACKPYLRDVNELKQNLDVNPTGYATCQ